jgi:hypothetical protein
MRSDDKRPAAANAPAEFHIRGHIQFKGPREWVASVAAVPAAGGSPASWDLIEETCPTNEDAESALRRLTITMGNRIRAVGGTVVTVETHDL